MQYVAFLRGINVGTAKRVAMADLRRVALGLGYTDVQTVLNSGNLVFSTVPARARAAAVQIEAAVRDELGVSSAVTVVPMADLAGAARHDPFGGLATIPSRLLVLFCRTTSARTALGALARREWRGEALAVHRGVGFAWCPRGIATSRLWKTLNAELGEGITARNRATIDRILMLHGSTPRD